MSWMIVPTLFILIVISLCICQVWLLKRGKKWFGLIIPIFNVLISICIFIPYVLKAYRINYNPNFFSLGSYTPFVFVFIYLILPTIIMSFTLIFFNKKRRIKKYI
jgi:ABC-type multidrug transport system fused ATPase/permease subunit